MNRSTLYVENQYLCDAGGQCSPPHGILSKETSKSMKGFVGFATSTTNRPGGIDTAGQGGEVRFARQWAALTKYSVPSDPSGVKGNQHLGGALHAA